MQEDMINQPVHPFITSISTVPHDVGQDFDPLSAAYAANPYPFYAHAREQEPVFFSPLFNMWVVTRYEEVTAVLKDHQCFSIALLHAGADRYTPEVQALLATSPIGSTRSIVAIDPPEHTRLRSCMNKAMSAQRIASLEPRIRYYANQLIDQFKNTGQADFIAQFAYLYPIRVIGSLMAVPEADMDQIQVWADNMTNLLFADLPAEQQLSHAQGYLALQQYVYNMVEQRQKAPQDDLVSDLFKSGEADQAPLSIAEAAATLVIVLIAGFDTTAKFLGNCLNYLLNERKHWQAILDDPNCIPALVEEELRFNSSTLGTFRRTTQAIELGGKTIPKGAMIHALMASANHDEAIFSDSELFDPHREKLNRHIAFGYGIHRCIGAPLARIEMCIALKQLSQRLPSLRLVPDQEIIYTPSLALHGPKQLLVEWDSNSI